MNSRSSNPMQMADVIVDDNTLIIILMYFNDLINLVTLNTRNILKALKALKPLLPDAN